MKHPPQPSRILMLKSHSAGIGDLLRSSAAWRVLKNAYPGAELHLVLFSREPGYPSEELIRDHHLLSSFGVVDKRTEKEENKRQFWPAVRKIGERVRPDMVIDFEPNGIRTSLVAASMSFRHRAKTVGISSVPGRGLFYSLSAPSGRKYARLRGLEWPLEYTTRDFVTLVALGLERNDCPIELRESAAGKEAWQTLRRAHGLDGGAPLLGLNIGCGTPDAVGKRPDLELLSELVAGLQRERRMQLVLMGAPFERDINREFCELHRHKCAEPIVDLAGETSISGLTGIINACAFFISSDSGPYHMGVAMGVPTLAIFRFDNRPHCHSHPWVRCCIAPGLEQLPMLRQASEELLNWAAIHRANTAGAPAAP